MIKSLFRWLAQAAIKFIETIMSWPEYLIAPNKESDDDE